MAAAVTRAAVALAALVVLVPAAQWLEGRIAARLRGGRAPSRPGPAGVFGPLGRIAGLLTRPQPAAAGDLRLHRAAPLVALAIPVLLLGLALAAAAESLLPGAGMGAEPAAGLLCAMAAAALLGQGAVLAGPGGGTREAAAAAARALAIHSGALVSWALCLVALAAFHGSDRISDIALAQAALAGPLPRWNLWLQPLGLVCYLASALALAPARPFAAAAAVELGGGYLAGYGGVRQGLMAAGRQAFLAAAAILGAQLYMAGPHLPVPPAWGHSASTGALAAKSLVLLTALLWAGAALPRLPARRAAQVGWQVLTPLAALNLVIAAALAALQV
ncbi:MAG: NADH-quinone oxidoreductase subunit H [Gemmatimonadota bacterium]